VAGGTQQGDGMPLAEINVTPLVDVMLVLLIIFMVTVPMMDQGVTLDLPKTKGNPLESTAEEQLVLKVLKDKSLRLNDRQIGLEALKVKIPSLFKDRKDRTIYVRADKNVTYGFVAYVVGELRSLGVEKLGLVTIPLDEGK
jgi:biopolymer transport protein TolR